MSTMQEHRDSMLREQMVMELRTLNVLLAMKMTSADSAVNFIKNLQKQFDFDKEYDERYDFRFGKKD